MKFLPGQFRSIDVKMSSKQFYPLKDFQYDQIQRSSSKIRMQECRFEFDTSYGRD